MPDLALVNRVKDLFSEALELDDAGRTSLLTRAAAENPFIEHELRSLISAHERASHFLCEPSTSALPSLPAGESVGDWIDRYHLVEVLGEGGFGCVYRAQQTEPVSRTVAVKVIKAGMDTRQVIARFQAERQTLALMNHPGIARVFDAGATAAGRPYFVMEYVEGVPITDYCDQRRLTVSQRLELMLQVCAAVQHAHAKGVIHRDLKPGNVLVSEADGQAQPKIIDFGIAKAFLAPTSVPLALTEQRQMIGTPEYISPEQAAAGHGDIDTRSDVYALGVVLYQLLTGTTPFDRARLRSAGWGELQRIVREEEPPKPSQRLMAASDVAERARCFGVDCRTLIAAVRGDLDWITLKATAKDRERRYGGASDLAADIRRHLDHEPVLARPPGAGYRLRKLIRRNRVAAAATSLIAIALVTGAVVATIGVLRARTAAVREREAARQTTAINEFMRGVLTSANPDRLGGNVRLADVLNEASITAAAQFADHPQLEAQLRDVLATAYIRLTHWNQASQQASRAVELWKSTVGPDDMRTIDASLRLAQALVNLQRARECRAILDDAIPRIDRTLGPNHTMALMAQAVLTELLKIQGQPEECDRLLRTLIARADDAGVDDAMKIKLLDSLLNVQKFLLDRIYSATDPAVLDECERCAKRLLEQAQTMAIEGELYTFKALQALAFVALRRGHVEQAASQCRTLLDTTRDRLGDCHVIRMWAMQTLAEALDPFEHAAEAADLYLKVVECSRSMTGADGVVLISHLSDVQVYLERAERWAQAESCCRETIDRLNALAGHTGTYYLEARLAHFISHQSGRMQEADAMFQRLLALNPAEALTDANDSDRARLQMYYADHLIRLGEFERAERLLDEVRTTGLAPSWEFARHPPDDLLYEFKLLYDAWGKPDKAAEIQQLIDQRQRELVGASR